MTLLKGIAGQIALVLVSLALLVPLYFIGQTTGGVEPERPGAPQPQQAPRRKSLAKRVVLALPAFGLLAALYVFGLVPGGSSAGAGPVRIESVSVGHLPQASSPRIEVAVALKNHDGVTHDVQVWWLLARPGASRPWEVYALRSSTQGPHSVAPGETLELNWWEEVAAEPGTYELSVWVHTIEGDVTQHSDGARIEAPTITIDSGWSQLIRRVTPSDLQVSTIDLPADALGNGLPTPNELPMIIGIRNDTPADARADVQWFLYRKAARLPWNGKPAYTSGIMEDQTLAADSNTAVRIGEPISLWPGEYLLRLVVTPATDEGAPYGDDAFLIEPVKLLENTSPSGIIRADSDPGPVAIERLTVDTESFQLGEGSLDVTLRNHSDVEQTAVLWWFLARPGSLEPWVEFATQSHTYPTTIAAERASTIDLSDEALVPPGAYELSVWVHTLNADGEESHSDGAWFNRPVEVR